MKRCRREFRLTPEEIVMLTLAGEAYEGHQLFSAKYGWDARQWPNRGFVVYTNTISGKFTYTWDKRFGWIGW